ncbi:MAG: hypothetical protein RL300_1846, partial [Pseudomonadota bacterium]
TPRVNVNGRLTKRVGEQVEAIELAADPLTLQAQHDHVLVLLIVGAMHGEGTHLQPQFITLTQAEKVIGTRCPCAAGELRHNQEHGDTDQFLHKTVAHRDVKLAKSITVILFRLVMVLALLNNAGCAWLDAQQRQLIYRPTASSPNDVALLQAGDRHYFVALPATDPQQRLAIWWLPHADADAPTLLYLHGTFRNLFGNQRKIEALRSAGYSVLAVDYRGWGDSSRLVPSEQSIVADAEVAWAELKKYQPLAHKRAIFGHSMGSGVALDLATRLQHPADYGGLVLESAFTSFSDVAKASGWLASLLDLFNPERFDSMGKITHIHAPLLMLHGSQDDTVPVELGERLFAAANAPKRWLVIENAGHSDLDQADPTRYLASLRDFASTYLSGQ